MTHHSGISRRLKAYAYRKQRVSRRINFLAACRLVVFLLMITGVSFSFGSTLALQGGALFLASCAVFLYLMVVQDRCYRHRNRLDVVLDLLNRDLARAERRFGDLPPAAMSFEPGHPFAHDLDFHGTASLIKLLDGTYHDRARAHLKAWIDTPDAPGEIRARMEAVADLSRRRLFLQRTAVAARLHGVPDLSPSMLRNWLDAPKPWTLSPAAYAVGLVTTLATTTLVVMHFFFKMDVPWLPMLLLRLAVFYGFDRVHGAYTRAFMQHGHAFAAVCAMAQTLVLTPFEAARPRALKQALMPDGHKDVANLKRLIALHEYLGYRANGFAHFFLNALLMWDQHFLFRLEAWRRAYGSRLPDWVDGLLELEALASLADYRRLFPHQPFAELREGHDIFIEAKKLGHPCLPDAGRVGNDYAIAENGRLHLITGSNMSGKSTFLRSVGVNLVLARLGAPVCADRFTCSLPRLWTSIHIQDNLAQGVSYFYAEVLRIKRILDEIGTDERPVFYLMDEILKGTNSRERLIATKAMVRFLLAHRASGLITTHDLELLAIEKERPDVVTNYHFQETAVADEMVFDYILKDGELTSTNALRVMRFAGIPLTFDEGDAP